MSTISTISSGAYARTSPLELLKSELTSEVSAGTIEAGDQDALGAALDSINQTLRSQDGTARASGARPTPDQMKSRIDDLIAQQVESGKLTSDQASELQGVFENALAKGPSHAGHGQGPGPGGPNGSGGPGGIAGASDNNETDDADTDPQALLTEFLETLQQQAAVTSRYDGSGQRQGATAPLLFDYQS